MSIIGRKFFIIHENNIQLTFTKQILNKIEIASIPERERYLIKVYNQFAKEEPNVESPSN